MATEKEKQQLIHLDRISTLAAGLLTELKAWRDANPDMIPEALWLADDGLKDLISLIDHPGGLVYSIESEMDEDDDEEDVDIDAIERTSTLLHKGE